MRVHHIGIVVDDIEKSIKIYRDLGYKILSKIIKDEIQYNKLVFLRSEDGSQLIELIQAINDKSTVYNSKNKGYHHICYLVKEMDKELNEFKEKGIGIIFTKKITAPAFKNKDIAFAYLKNGTIIEFVEKGIEDEFI